MSLQIVCPGCDASFDVPDDAAGEYVRCPGGHWLIVPDKDYSLPVDPVAEQTLPEPSNTLGRAPRGNGILVLILALLVLLMVGGLGVCLVFLFGEPTSPRRQESVASMVNSEAPPVTARALRAQAKSPANPEEKGPDVLPQVRETKSAELQESNPPVPPELSKGSPEPSAEEKRLATPIEETLSPGQFMLGRMDRLERDKLDDRSSSNADGPTPAVWEGHTNHVRMVAFTADGRFVLSVSGDVDRIVERPADNSIRVWDARTGRQIHKLEGFAEALDGLCVSPGGRFALFGHGGRWDGKQFVAAKEHGIFLWDVQAKHVIEPITDAEADAPRPRFVGAKGQAFCTAISPDRKTIAVGDRMSYVTLWDTESGRLTRQVKIPYEKGKFRGVLRVRFTPDGQRLVVVNYDQSIRIYGTDGELITRLPDSHRDIVWALDVAAGKDGRVLALTGGGSRLKKDRTGFEPGDKDYAIRLWDVERGEVVREFTGHTRQVGTVAFCPDCRHFVSCGQDRTVRLWNLESGEGVILGRHDGGVRTVAVAPDSRSCVSGGFDCKVRFWQLPVE
jgi:WD40 repeat protein